MAVYALATAALKGLNLRPVPCEGSDLRPAELVKKSDFLNKFRGVAVAVDVYRGDRLAFPAPSTLQSGEAASRSAPRQTSSSA